MTTVTLSEHASSGYLSCSDGTYANARAGTGTLAVGASGQRWGQEETTTFFVYQTFAAFDTSGIPSSGYSIATATLQMNWAASDLSSSNFIVEARSRTWLSGGLTTGDFVAGTSLAGLTLLASIDTSGIVGNDLLTSEAVFTSSLNLSGNTEIIITSSRQRIGNAPTGTNTGEYVRSSALDWKLIVEYNEVNSSYQERIVSTGNRWRA
jgi:hypothetical protein